MYKRRFGFIHGILGISLFLRIYYTFRVLKWSWDYGYRWWWRVVIKCLGDIYLENILRILFYLTRISVEISILIIIKPWVD